MKRSIILACVSLLILCLFAACGLVTVKHILQVEVIGEGRVSPQAGSFEEGTVITFDLEPADDWLFSRWEGEDGADVQAEDGAWKLLMDGPKNIQAVFEMVPYPLTINIVGEGRVEQELIGVYPQGTDTEYPPYAMVKLTAIADQGWTFQEWIGDFSGYGSVVVVTMNEAKELTVVFDRNELDLHVDVIGQGTVRQEIMPAIADSFAFETVVKLTAIADPGYEFIRWQGDIESAAREIEVVIDEVKRLTAVFSMPVLSGYVTETRGGPAVEDARVYIEGYTETWTDADGFFVIDPIIEGSEFDLWIEKEGELRALVQDICLAAGESLQLEIPVMETAETGLGKNPARIIVDGVERGDTISGVLPLDVTIDGELDSYVFYVYFGGGQRNPAEVTVIESNNRRVSIDTKPFIDGDYFIRLLAYDLNNNVTMLVIPVTVANNLTGGEGVPDDLNYLRLTSVSYGQTFGYYSQERQRLFDLFDIEGDPNIIELQTGQKVDLCSFPDRGTLFIRVEWDPAVDAEGYHVYRSFDGETFRRIGDIPYSKQRMDPDRNNFSHYGYDDYSPELTPNQTVYYKVVPYNKAGAGNGLVRAVTPLPPFNVILRQPAHNSFDVPLQPKFIWESDVELGPDINEKYTFQMFEGARPYYYRYEDLDKAELDFGRGGQDVTLRPGAVHTWDIVEAKAYILYEEDINGFSAAEAIAGKGWGSWHGEAIFTTTTETQ